MEKGIIGGSQENFIPIRNLGRIHNLHNKGNKNERDRIQEKSIWKNTKGVLYTWSAAMNGSASSNNVPSGVRGLCPVGWHIPGNDEWAILETTIGGYSNAGIKLKETGTIHWSQPNEASNASGFSAITVYYWSSTETSASNATGRYLQDGYDPVSRITYKSLYTGSWNKRTGASIRCIKDTGPAGGLAIISTIKGMDVSQGKNRR